MLQLGVRILSLLPFESPLDVINRPILEKYLGNQSNPSKYIIISYSLIDYKYEFMFEYWYVVYIVTTLLESLRILYSGNEFDRS